jgi:hypothetical protein
MSTHELLQLVRPVPQVVVHTPTEQTCPVVHALPHAPQFAASLAVSVHTPLQRVPPA